MLNLDIQHWLESVGIQQQDLSASANGLTGAEANGRIAKYGKNIISVIKKRSLVLQFLSRFRNPLVILLLVASAIYAFTADLVSFVIIVCMVVLSVTLNFIQEHRAERAAQSLRRSVAVKATVLRDKNLTDINVELIVPGDLVPVDGLIIEADDFFVNQALLTGEPYPVEKHATNKIESEMLQAPVELDTAINAVFAGTHVLSGSATSLSIVGVAITLPFTSISTYFGFIPLPIKFFSILLTMGIGYLVMVEFIKRWFYRVYNKSKF